MRFYGSYSNPILIKCTKMAFVYIYLGQGIPRSVQGACAGCPIYSYRESCTCAPCTSRDSPGLVRWAWWDLNLSIYIEMLRKWKSLVDPDQRPWSEPTLSVFLWTWNHRPFQWNGHGPLDHRPWGGPGIMGAVHQRSRPGPWFHVQRSTLNALLGGLE